MPDSPIKPRITRRRILIAIGIFAIIAAPLVIFGRGVTQDQIDRLNKSHAAVIELHGKIAAEKGQFRNNSDSARAQSADPPTTISREAAQARCDKLFTEIYAVPKPGQQRERIEALLPKARELAWLYDTGVRVSAEAKVGLCGWENEFLTVALAERLIAEAGYQPDSMQTPDDIVRFTIAGAKFVRVVDLPTIVENPVIRRLQEILDPPRIDAYSKTKPYPKSLLDMDLDLIAPKRPWYWRQQLPYHLEIASSQASGLASELSSFRNTYAARSGSAPVRFTKTLCYMPFRRGSLEHQVQFLEQLTAQADKIYEYPDLFMAMPGQDDNTWKLGYWAAGQEKARLICAAIEMLRGAPVPDHPLPDSYFYDIYIGGRIRIEQSTLHSRDIRVTLSCGYPTGKPMPWKNAEITFVVPPDHPAVKALK